MIIGFDGSRAFVSERTGTEEYSYQIFKALTKIDHQNQYIIYVRPQTFFYSTWPNNFVFKKINWPRLWTQAGLSIQSFKDNLDVLFVPAHTLPVIRKPGLKSVVTVHDLGSEYLPGTHQLKQRIYLSYMQRKQLKGATRIIAVSKATKKDLVKRIGIEPEKVTVIYEGYDQKLFKPIRGDILVNSLKPYYLFVGTVQPRKNLERVIKAFAKIKDKKLVIAGSKGWLADQIYKLPKKLGIEDKVKFLGYVPDEKLPALYSAAEALVFPSLFEGFGLPILEAQACGCPVLTSKISSMPEVAGKGALLVNPYDVNEITNAMIEVMDQSVRNKLIKNGFENVKRFSWEKCAAQTLEVFEELRIKN